MFGEALDERPEGVDQIHHMMQGRRINDVKPAIMPSEPEFQQEILHVGVV